MKILPLTQEVLGHKLLDWESLPGRYYSLLPLFFLSSYSIYCRSVPREGHWTVVLVCFSGLKATPNSEQWWACWPTFKHYSSWSQQCQVLPLDLALALPHPRWLLTLRAQLLDVMMSFTSPTFHYFLCPAGRNTWHLTCPHNIHVFLGALRDRIFPSLDELLLFLWSQQYNRPSLGSQDLVCLVAQSYKDSIPHA